LICPGSHCRPKLVQTLYWILLQRRIFSRTRPAPGSKVIGAQLQPQPQPQLLSAGSNVTHNCPITILNFSFLSSNGCKSMAASRGGLKNKLLSSPYGQQTPGRPLCQPGVSYLQGRDQFFTLPAAWLPYEIRPCVNHQGGFRDQRDNVQK
jgi:hypothetical protein